MRPNQEVTGIPHEDSTEERILMELSGLLKRIEAAEQMEHEARIMEQQGLSQWLEMKCDACWKSEPCRKCEFQPLCEEMDLMYRGRIKDLFERSYAIYTECVQDLRKLVTKAPTEEGMRILALGLRDMDIHPKNIERDRRELFWESQYWFLRLYYTFGKDSDLRQAQQLEDFRHAVVKRAGRI